MFTLRCGLSPARLIPLIVLIGMSDRVKLDPEAALTRSCQVNQFYQSKHKPATITLYNNKFIIAAATWTLCTQLDDSYHCY